jgi:hypothetical protein
MKLSTIVKSEKNNPDLQSQLNITELLESARSTNLYYHEQSLSDVSKEIVDILRKYTNSSIVSLLCEKLIDYKYIDKVYQLKFGSFLRWIPFKLLSLSNSSEETPSIKNMIKQGGLLVKIIFTESGTNLLIRHLNRFSQIKMNEHLIFQRLSDDEKLVMGCRDLISSI